MRNVITLASLLWLGLFIAIFCACSESDKVAGGVSEETNTLAGVLLDHKGKAASGVVLTARHFTMDSIVLVDTTDSDGQFGLPLKRQGKYGLSAQMDSHSYYETVDYEGSDISITAELQNQFNISGTLNLRVDTVAANVSVYIPGSEWNAVTDKNGHFSLKGVPMGKTPLIAESPDPIRFNDAVYLVEVEEKNNAFLGPLPSEMLYVLIEDTTEIDETLFSSKDTLNFPLSSEYGIRSWWSMDYLTTSTNKLNIIDDVRGGTESMLVYGKTELDSGVNNSALVLKGAKNYGVVENDKGILDSIEAFVLEASLEVDSIISSEKAYRKNIIGKIGFGSEEENDVFSLAVIQNVCDVKKPSLAFFIADGAHDSLSCENAVVASKPLKLKSWVYVTVVWNAGNLSLYLDGKLSNEKKVSVEKINVSSEPIFFGKEAMDLKLDDVRLGTKAITDVDVLYRYYLKGGAI